MNYTGNITLPPTLGSGSYNVSVSKSGQSATRSVAYQQTSTNYTPVQEAWRRIHATYWPDPVEFAARKAEALRWKQRGMTMFKFTIELENWYIPAGRANMIAFAQYCRDIGLKVGLHIQFSYYRRLIGADPAWNFLTLGIGEKFNSNSGKDPYPESNIPISLALLRPLIENTPGWDGNNAMKRILEEVVIDVIDKIRPDTVGCGRTEEYEMGIGNKVSPLWQGMVGLYEDQAKLWFKEWAIKKGGGTVQGLRNLVNFQELTDSGIIPPTPEYYGNGGEGFWDLFTGDGKGNDWNKMAHYHFGVDLLDYWLVTFADYCRMARPNQHITVEAGAIDNIQAVMARSNMWPRYLKTANASQVNWAPDANYPRSCDLQGSHLLYWGGDWDNIWDPVTQRYKKNYGVPNGQGDITQDQAAERGAIVFNNGGSWGFFGGHEANLVELWTKVNEKTDRIGKPVPVINRAPTIRVNTGAMRRRESTGLDAWSKVGTNLIFEEEPYLA